MNASGYLLDEHVDPLLKKMLKQLSSGFRVWRIGDPGAPPFGTPDPDILIWCEQHAFILVTNNRHSMPAHLRAHIAAGQHIPGIFIIKMEMGMSVIAKELDLVWGTSVPDEYADAICFLPLSS